MSEDIFENEVGEKELDDVTGGGKKVEGLQSLYDTPDAVVFTFAGYTFVRVSGLMKRTKILKYEAAIDERTGMYGAHYYCQDNGGKLEWYWDDELSFTIL